MTSAEYQLRSWEKGLVAASSLLFFSALALYLSGYPLLTSWTGEGSLRVGEVADKSGTLRRGLMSEDLFREIQKSTPLFENDTVVTDSQSTATLQLDGGTTIQLDPNSMVRLSFLSELSMTGISRVPRVDIVSGKVRSKAAQKPVRIATQGKPVEVLETGIDAIQTAKLGPFVPARPVAPAQEVLPPPVPELELASPAVVVPPPPANAPIVPVAEAPPAPVAQLKTEAPTAEASLAPQTAPSAIPSALPSEAPVAQVSATPSAVPSAQPSAVPPVVFNPKEIKQVRVLFPKAKARLRVPADSKTPVVDWDMKWMAKPAKRPLKVSLYRLKRNNGEISREELFTQIVQTTGAPTTTRHKIDAPGEYEWELQGPNGESLAAVGKPFVQFTVEPEFVGIHPKEPLVGGKKAGSNRVEDRVIKEFDVMLGWSPYPEASEYKVWIATSPDAKKPLIERTVKDKTTFALNKDQVFKGRMFYRVKAQLPNGFVVTSPMKPFIFDFLAPLLTRPEDKYVVTKFELEASGGGVLFTWQKTNFTEEYTFELARDSQFKSMVEQETLPDNFLTLKAPPPGTYYWRVKSRAKSLDSSPSAPNSFVIQR